MALIRVIDFEGTGLHPGAEVIEVGHCDLDSETGTILAGGSYLCRPIEPCPADSRAVHHIRSEDVAGLPPYDRHILYEAAVRAGVAAFAAHSADYEERFLYGSIPCICTHKAALRVWPDAPKHSVFALLYWLEDQGLAYYDRERAYPPHRASPDAYATAILLGAMIAAGTSATDLWHWSQQPRLLPRIPIGNWRGKRWDECDRGFLTWIIGKRYSDMDPDIIWNAERELERRDELWRMQQTAKAAGN